MSIRVGKSPKKYQNLGQMIVRGGRREYEKKTKEQELRGVIFLRKKGCNGYHKGRGSKSLELAWRVEEHRKKVVNILHSRSGGWGE